MKPKAGTYALIMESPKPFSKHVGRLGYLKGNAGYYFYIGSAFGPGGIKARVNHHMRISKKKHWHIDYLRRSMKILEIWYSYEGKKMEHQWAKTINNLEGASSPFPGFGSSDCLCASHLFYFQDAPLFDDVKHLLGIGVKSIAPVKIKEL